MKRPPFLRHGALALCLSAGLVGCASIGGDRDPLDTSGGKFYAPLSAADFARLTEPEQIRYFTDNVYLAATGNTSVRDQRAQAAREALKQLRAQLDQPSFVRFWSGVDGEFFGRVNAAFEIPDYTRPQAKVDGRRVRTAYNLGARHLAVLDSQLGEARRLAMRHYIELAAKNDPGACFGFHKAYKDYPDPRVGDPTLTWELAEGKPFRKSMWTGSAETLHQGRPTQIAIPAEVVMGCRRILHPPADISAGLVHEMEQFFTDINLIGGFDLAGYKRRKTQWQDALRAQALEAAQRMGRDRIMIINVVNVYQVFPPEMDYEYELAVTEGTLPELVASGILEEEQAFKIEQRVIERRLMLTGIRVTPERTPLAFLQLTTEKVTTSGK